jgi:hypothetical protein
VKFALTGVILLLNGLAAQAGAQTREINEPGPQFSSTDLVVISRNKTLKSLLKADPQVVRHALDTIARVQTSYETRTTDQPGSSRKRSPKQQEADPDLAELERSAPEAAHDLFQLIKQAATKTRPIRR